ncbi:MAG: DivIVA domain-containing protein [Bacteroidetes bacterium]|nr:DivIVA domain-containing protein [Bacteroidota bacterium]MCW5895777.1 DivIVA domain-containing protein [Bacteroidota bacterium]
MKLSPLDIRKQEFKKVMRGYDPIEVETFTETMANEFENLLKEQNDLRTKIVELETQLKDYKQMERTLQQTLMQAQEATGKTYEAARRDAESIVKEAELKAAQILNLANDEMGKLNNEITQLKSRKDSLIGRLRVLLSSELDLIKSLEVGNDPVLSNDSSRGTGKDNIDLDNILKAIENVGTPESH